MFLLKLLKSDENTSVIILGISVVIELLIFVQT